MARGPDDRLDGVVRALRWRNSPLGPFSTSHETILAYCATILASLLRVWDPRPEPTVVISYGNATLKDHLVRFLNVIGVKSLHLGDTACGGIPNAYFEDLVQRAHAGIAIAVPARRGSRGAAQHEPSLNVAHEIGQMISRFPGRLLVLKEQRCDYAMGGNIGRVLEFSMAEGIFRRMTDVAAALREWGLIGNPSVD
jgi:hypothetical protein